MVLWWFGKSAIRTRKARGGILIFMPTSVKEVHHIHKDNVSPNSDALNKCYCKILKDQKCSDLIIRKTLGEESSNLALEN